MDIDRFQNSPVGRLQPMTVWHAGREVDYFGFVPDPLPSEVPLSDATHLAVSQADQALGLLEGVAGVLPSRDLLIRPIIRREAVSTSALEGTYAGLSEVLEAEVTDDRRWTSEVLEVLNYAQTTERALTWIEEGKPITLNLIKSLQETLVSGTRGDTADTGEFRSVPVMIGPNGAPPEAAHFIPGPPGDELRALLEDWETWNYKEDNVPAIVRAAISHYQFETIHPFRDGNGRLGRLLAILLLIERGPLTGHLFSLSPYLEARRGEYGELLRGVSAEGDYDSWVRFFATAVTEQASQGRTRVSGLLDWREETVSRLRHDGLRGTVISIAESLIGYPFTSPSQAQHQFNVTYRAANRAIGQLSERGILAEITGRSYGRVFAAPGVMRILES
jgi:Fic family protein